MVKIQYNSQSLINAKYLLIIASKNSNWCWTSRKIESPLCHVVWSTNLKYIFFEKYVVGNSHIKMIVSVWEWVPVSCGTNAGMRGQLSGVHVPRLSVLHTNWFYPLSHLTSPNYHSFMNCFLCFFIKKLYNIYVHSENKKNYLRSVLCSSV